MRKFILISLAILLLGSALVGPVSADESIEACDSAGVTIDYYFSPGDEVYLKGSGLTPGATYHIYIVEEYDPWIWGTTTKVMLHVVRDYGTITIGADGKIWPVKIWDSAVPGLYDVWADNISYDLFDDNDHIDDFDVSSTGPPGPGGFFVIPEIPLGAITVLLVCFAATSLKRRKFF